MSMLFQAMAAHLRASGGFPSVRRSGSEILDNDRTKIHIYCYENLDTGSVSATSAFSIDNTNVTTAKTLIDVDVSGYTISLTYDSAFVPGDAPTISYVQPNANPIKGLYGNFLNSFTNIYPENQMEGPAVSLGPQTGHLFTSGGGGWVLDAGNPQDEPRYGNATWADDLSNIAYYAYDGINGTTPSQGWVEMQVTDTNAAIRALGFSYGYLGNSALNSPYFNLRLQNGSVQAYSTFTSVGTAYTPASQNSLQRVRLKRHMPSFAVTFDYSTDGGVNWTTHYTFAGTLSFVVTPWFYTNSTTVAVVGLAGYGLYE
jgi:hypothetical protein